MFANILQRGQLDIDKRDEEVGMGMVLWLLSFIVIFYYMVFHYVLDDFTWSYWKYSKNEETWEQYSPISLFMILLC